MSATHRLLMTVAEAALLFTVMSWALVPLTGIFVPQLFMPHRSLHDEQIAALVVVLVPDSLATWWIFRRLRADRPRNDARRAAIAFSVSAPLVLAVGYVLGVMVGGYAEVILGSHLILPAVAALIIVLMIFVPSGVVMWALHPSGGVGVVGENDQDEHC